MNIHIQQGHKIQQTRSETVDSIKKEITQFLSHRRMTIKEVLAFYSHQLDKEIKEALEELLEERKIVLTSDRYLEISC